MATPPVNETFAAFIEYGKKSSKAGKQSSIKSEDGSHGVIKDKQSLELALQQFAIMTQGAGTIERRKKK